MHDCAFSVNASGTGINDIGWSGNKRDLELMQFTGLHDKNGKEIYEGDILSISNGKAVGVVEFQNAQFHLNYIKDEFRNWSKSKFLDEYSSSHSQEVIGNIYENPELLEEK